MPDAPVAPPIVYDKPTDNAEANRIAEAQARQMKWSFAGEDTEREVQSATLPAQRAPSLPPVVLLPDLPLDQIVCGDNLAGLQTLPDGCAGLVITSPPYFQQRDYGGLGAGNETSLAAYLNTLLALFAECVRVTRKGGSIVFNLGDKYEDSSLLLVPYRFAIAATEAFPVRLVNNITWVKQNPTPRQFRRRLVSSTEPFFHFALGNDYFYDIDAFLDSDRETPKKAPAPTTRHLGRKYFDLIDGSDLPDAAKSHARRDLTGVIGEVQRGEIAGFRMKIRGIHAEAFGGQEGGRKIQMERQGFTIIRLQGKRMKRDIIETPVETLKGCPHPAIYPVQIVSEFLRLLTREGDLVIDPFLGSGTTAVACKQLNRHYIGYDINPAYCDYARLRVADL